MKSLKKLLKNFMSKHQEIEIRGPLRSGDENIFSGLKNYLKIVKDKQLAIFIKEPPLSLRIKSNQTLSHIEFIQKKKLGGSRSIQNEVCFKIQKNDVKDFLFILSQLGINNGLYSPSDRTDIYFPDIVWSVKRGTVLGDYWEAEATKELMSKLKTKKDVIKYLINSASKIGLKCWSEIEFKEHMDFSWKGIKPQPLHLLWKKYLN